MKLANQPSTHMISHAFWPSHLQRNNKLCAWERLFLPPFLHEVHGPDQERTMNILAFQPKHQGAQIEENLNSHEKLAK